MRSILFSLFWCGCAILLAGCGKSETYVPVSGTVFLDGKPLVGAMVLFQPMGDTRGQTDGIGSTGRTDDQGRFTLEVSKETPIPGALVGKHRVRIGMPPPTGGDTKSDAIQPTKKGAGKVWKDPVPEKYNTQTTLEIDITGPTDQLKFDLKTD
jgi:hypothetical protein